jgi:hypothetical protein
MTKRIDFRAIFIFATSLLLSAAFVPHAGSAGFSEPVYTGLEVFEFSPSELPRVAPMQISANLKTIGELVERLEMLEDSDAPANIVAALQSTALAVSTEMPINEAVAALAESGSDRLAINSEAPEACRASSIERSAYNYGAVAESECTCELYQRNPEAKFGNASAKEFHWVKSCKKARYKAG